MSWKEKMKEWGPASLQFLSTDGASITFIVVGDPMLLKGKYKGKEQDRIGFPMVTEEGFFLFIGGKRIARKLASLEDKFSDHVITITRHGVEGDTDAKYDVVAVKDGPKYKALNVIKGHSYSEQALNDAVEEAGEVMGK